jgi:hypothetical protein
MSLVFNKSPMGDFGVALEKEAFATASFFIFKHFVEVK